MKIIESQAAQGDVMFRRIDTIPADASPVEPVRGAYIVAHSETGHNHVVMERPGVRMFSGMDELRAYLVIEGDPAPVEHQRDFDTHQTFGLSAGTWEVRRQREFTPEGFRRAQD